MEGEVDYFYLHEKPKFKYRVVANPPPADSSEAEFHKSAPDGESFHTDRSLRREGGGEVPLDLKAKGLTIGDSPIFIEFTFKKGALQRKDIVAVSLAEPAVREIAAPAEAYPKEKIHLEVVAWDAKAYDQPGNPTQFEERNPARITKEVRDETKWQRDGEDLAERGETIDADCVKEEHLGKFITVEAFLGDAPPGKTERVTPPRTSNRLTRSRLRKSYAFGATAQIAVPKLKITGQLKVKGGEEITLYAEIEPSIDGTYAWRCEQGKERIELAPETAQTKVKGKVASQAEGDVTVECVFTSAATKRAYRAQHVVTVVEDLYWIEIELKDEEGPVKQEPYLIELPDGSKREGKLDDQGFARVESLPARDVKVRFPERDATAWEALRFELPKDEPAVELMPVAEGWIEIELRDASTGAPVPFEPFLLELEDGSTREGTLDGSGRAVVESLVPGTVKVRFPERDATAFEAAAQVEPPPAEKPLVVDMPVPHDWIEVELVDASTGEPVPYEPFVVELDGGTTRAGTLDGEGYALVEDLPPGNVKVRFPERDATAFEARSLAPAPEPEKPAVVEMPLHQGWVEIELQDDGAPVPFEPFVIEVANVATRDGRLDTEGYALVENIPEGIVKVRFPERDASAFAGAPSR